MNLILASSSPRRRQLLADAGLKFVLAEPYEVAEEWPENVPAEKVAEYVAELKSEAYPRALAEGDVLLTADTTVVLGDRILGKPADSDDAIRMLGLLSGRKHEVVTGVVLRGEHKCESFSVATKVWFRELRPDEIEYYVRTFAPLDKAGAYGIQEWIGHVGVTRIDGSFYNVMGLPVQTIYARLDGFALK